MKGSKGYSAEKSPAVAIVFSAYRWSAEWDMAFKVKSVSLFSAPGANGRPAEKITLSPVDSDLRDLAIECSGDDGTAVISVYEGPCRRFGELLREEMISSCKWKSVELRGIA